MLQFDASVWGALSRQISIGDFRRRIPPSVLVIHERKQWNSRPPRCASRQYRIYSDNASLGAVAARDFIPKHDRRRKHASGLCAHGGPFSGGISAGDTAKGEAFADIAASLIKEAINRPKLPR